MAEEIAVDLTNSRRNRVDLAPANAAARNSIAELMGEYEAERAAQGENRLREVDRHTYFRQLCILVLDLLSAWEGDRTKFIGYSRGKQNFIKGGSYWDHETDTPLLSQHVYRTLVDFLAANGYVESHIETPGFKEFSSRMRASPRLAEFFERHELSWVSVSFDPAAPVIVVKDERKRLIPLPEPVNFDFDGAAASLRRINENLQQSFINLNVTDAEHDEILARLSGDQTSAGEHSEIGEPRQPLEFANRTLKRVFANSSYENGGRFYGGWWQGLPSEFRKFIEIDGFMTVEMDFTTMQPSMMYGLIGEPAPKNAYIPEGWPNEVREIGKKAFMQLINAKTVMQNEKRWRSSFAPNCFPDALPADWENLSKNAKARIQNTAFEERFGRPYTDLLNDMVKLHGPISEYLFSQAWGRMQRLDSDIAERVLIRLLDNEVPVTALPIHDSFIVRRGAEWDLFHTMHEVFEEVVGVPCDIRIDEAVYHRPEGYEPDGLVFGEDIHDAAKRSLIEKSRYHRRESQWERMNGPAD
ncbi:hypothetical protein KAJ83_13255 [Marivibrio halodurans]|uniref:Uncharacterized protein n=1 Tax=Marivibrio halodurans TaxID=2039722 RepID=A0A8J7S149_9PROT|nr:hypothetical protein [Marivibrio halodurans]MBP5857980.1 hypothetical protein [Marivibrio halodurans]